QVQVDPGCSILAVVGDGMEGSHRVGAKMFGARGKAALSVRAIAQCASARNISAVIDSKSSARALRSVHSSFYLSPHTVSVGLIGPGVVGSVLLDQLASQIQRLSRDLKLDLRVRGIMSSKRMHLADPQVQLPRWRDAFSSRHEPSDLARFAQHIHAEYLPHAIIIDCSSSADVADRYPGW